MAAPLTLHWSPKSPYVRKVMVCAHELGLVPQLKLVRSVAAMLRPNPEIMAVNPLSKIPTLVREDGSVLFDSVVICEYLNARAGGTLFPAEGEPRWQALRRHAFGDGLLDALILWRNERERQVPLQPLLEAFELKTRASLRMLDAEAAALAAEPFSIGQVTVGCALGYLDYRFDAFGWRAQAPRLADWFDVLCRRPSFQATRPVDG
ncbi:glutathione S-transferase [Variovorax sp. WS11]|uniref:glutathione S-transferase family protein n=1 Tax=Variovorax sp. WS11 TaxID=1105204 RepID=UPI000D0CED25|nr:glutathione S-transferase family protein [Variovorax sp. WS11]NDZ18277.1 glutathione S-transferase family protein [Variovorax sp. WS11]PSL84277.1 glutathione S-transferase [Variovorax sp. WS11]